jgi:hypothetical protein
MEDLTKLKNQATPITEPTLGDDDDFIEAEVVPSKSEEPHKEYTGKGVVVEKPTPNNNPNRAIAPGMTNGTMNAVKDELREMDEMIQAARENLPEAQRRFLDVGNGQTIPLPGHILKNMEEARIKYAKEKGLKPEEVDSEDASDEVKEARNADLANEVTILIDKVGMGQMNFTEEEQKRIDAAKKIHLVEVEDKKLHTVKIRKKDDKAKKTTYTKRSYNRSYAPVMALASLYTGKMMNVSSSESLQLIQRPTQNESTASLLEKWSLIYSKLTDCSVGDFKTFDDFISHTAYADYNNFIYTILCNSYPEEDSVTFTCTRPKCQKDFTVKYNNRALLRTTDVPPERIAVMNDLFERSMYHSKEDNYKYMIDNSVVSSLVRFRTDDISAILVDIYVPSVKEQVENILPRITPEMINGADTRMVVFAHNIRRILVPVNLDEVDNFDDLEYDEIDTLEDIVEFMKTFNDEQLATIETMITRMLRPYTVTYGLDDVVCTNCGHHHGAYSMNLDRLLFQRVQRRTQTTIE